MSDCDCYCHVLPGATCTVDNGMGVPGVPYCGPHLSGSLCVMEHGWTPEGHPQYREASTGLLCPGHRARLDALVDEIGELILDLAQCREAGTTPHEANGRKEHRKVDDTPPVPVNLDWVLLTDVRTPRADHGLPAVLSEYCVRLGLRSLPPKAHVLARLALLRRWHDSVARHDWVVTYAADLAEIKRVLANAVRDRRFTRVGACYLPVDSGGKCGGQLLAENGTGFVRCRTCGATWSTPVELARLRVTLG